MTLMESRDVVAERAEIDAEIAGGTLLTAFLITGVVILAAS